MRRSHLRPGMEVLVPHPIKIVERPHTEGRAELIQRMSHAPDVWRVRFVGEDITRLRFVHAGIWQSAPEQLLASLLLHWRATLDPSLLSEFPDLRPWPPRT